MSSVRVKSAMCDAMDSSLVMVEASYMRGFCGLSLIGSHSEVCRSGLSRAHTALENINIKIPQRKIVLSVVPADVKKDGNQFDLPFAVSIAILATKKAPKIDLDRWLFAAELSLDGTLRPIKGAVSFALAAMAEDFTGVIVAEENAVELQALMDLPAKNLKGIQILGSKNLEEVLQWVFGERVGDLPQLMIRRHRPSQKNVFTPNYDDMVLSKEMQQVALVSTVGRHSLCLYGPPGTGKSMFAQRLPSIMPPMEPKDLIVALKIHSSYMSRLNENLLSGQAPFRSPHHQTSSQALLGVPENPGELSLAYGGILFLDELPEFRRDLIESLREPLETGQVQVSRAKRKVLWQAKTTFVAAANNCPCGWLGSLKRKCYCPTNKVLAYKRKLSGPLLDRIDLHVNMKENTFDQSGFMVQLSRKKEQTEQLATKVVSTQEKASQRNSHYGVYYNSDLKLEHLIASSKLSPSELGFMVEKYSKGQVSNRRVLRLLRVARTLADLDQRERLLEQDIKHALRWDNTTAAIERGDQAFGLV
jgi:magnesium chelatase family protein